MPDTATKTAEIQAIVADLQEEIRRHHAELGVSDSDSRLLADIARVVRDLGGSSLPMTLSFGGSLHLTDVLDE